MHLVYLPSEQHQKANSTVRPSFHSSPSQNHSQASCCHPFMHCFLTPSCTPRSCSEGCEQHPARLAALCPPLLPHSTTAGSRPCSSRCSAITLPNRSQMMECLTVSSLRRFPWALSTSNLISLEFTYIPFQRAVEQPLCVCGWQQSFSKHFM